MFYFFALLFCLAFLLAIHQLAKAGLSLAQLSPSLFYFLIRYSRLERRGLEVESNNDLSISITKNEHVLKSNRYQAAVRLFILAKIYSQQSFNEKISDNIYKHLKLSYHSWRYLTISNNISLYLSVNLSIITLTIIG